jgi:uncharacterized LabA/DUF88 family protein
MNYSLGTILAVIAIVLVLATYLTGAPLVPVAVILLALAIIFGGNPVRRVWFAARHKIDAMRKKNPDTHARPRVLVLVDESNVGSSVRTAGRGLDWLKLRNFLAGPDTGRDLIEMVVYAGLPPAIPKWQDERDKKNKFVHWLRSNGFLVVTKDGAPAEEGHYKANVDVMMAIDALELSIEIRPDVVILVTGDADFAYLAIKLRRHGIRVEVASVSANLGNMLRSAANEVIDLGQLFRTFEIAKVQEAPAQPQPRTPALSGERRRRPPFRSVQRS